MPLPEQKPLPGPNCHPQRGNSFVTPKWHATHDNTTRATIARLNRFPTKMRERLLAALPGLRQRYVEFNTE